MTTQLLTDASKTRARTEVEDLRLDLVECLALEIRERFQAIANGLDQLTPACASADHALKDVQALAESGSAMTIQLLALFDRTLPTVAYPKFRRQDDEPLTK